MACNSRGLCPNCGGTSHECCGSKVSEEAHKHYRSRIAKLEAVVEAADRVRGTWHFEPEDEDVAAYDAAKAELERVKE